MYVLCNTKTDEAGQGRGKYSIYVSTTAIICKISCIEYITRGPPFTDTGER